jgi:hypothetical protein
VSVSARAHLLDHGEPPQDVALDKRCVVLRHKLNGILLYSTLSHTINSKCC